ncbi:hypothetical protein METSCH_C03770 [Metschnikowia aff. pulcherrima]|uniref:Uncharacterized protein n=1 Tax=Metschnikowia aff. pulcherrima TaxID=2163413 RepID=A0A4P6XNE6_9ASCO|nr:hypothetical protein METSCH_C03770 [Metschnikowia aff. pulcherrima]
MDLDNVRLQRRLHQRHGLHDQRVGVLHVQMHETHHSQRGEDRLDLGINLLQIVLLHGGHHGFLLLAAHRVGRLHVLHRGQVILLVDLELDIHTDGKNR